jgi:hypothetical protein
MAWNYAWHGIGKSALEMGAGGVGSGEREKRATVAPGTAQRAKL